MTTTYRTERFDKEHRHFGGLVYSSDFNTEYRTRDNPYGSFIASRIDSDLKRAWNTGSVNRPKKNRR